MKKQVLALTILATLISGSAVAATQGTKTTGGSSSGTLDVMLKVNPFIEVKGLNDITFADYEGDTLASVSEDFCVRSNASTFNVTFADYDNASSTKFELRPDGGTATSVVDYKISLSTLDESNVATDLGAVAYNTTVSNIAERRSVADCKIGGVPSNNMQITVSLDDLGSNAVSLAEVGDYKGYLSIVVAPE